MLMKAFSKKRLWSHLFRLTWWTALSAFGLWSLILFLRIGSPQVSPSDQMDLALHPELSALSPQKFAQPRDDLIPLEANRASLELDPAKISDLIDNLPSSLGTLLTFVLSAPLASDQEDNLESAHHHLRRTNHDLQIVNRIMALQGLESRHPEALQVAARYAVDPSVKRIATRMWEAHRRGENYTKTVFDAVLSQSLIEKN